MNLRSFVCEVMQGIDDITLNHEKIHTANKRDAICILLRLVCNRVAYKTT